MVLQLLTLRILSLIFSRYGNQILEYNFSTAVSAYTSQIREGSPSFSPKQSLYAVVSVATSAALLAKQSLNFSSNQSWFSLVPLVVDKILTLIGESGS